LKTVLEVLRGGAAFLERKGIEQPRLNTEHLLAQVLGLKRLELYLAFDRPLGESELRPMRELIERRSKGEPLQHLLGTVEFGGHVFKCDRRALVPRPETEELVDRIVKRARQANGRGPGAILDMGCGSGVIGLSLAATFPSSVVTLVDVSSEALALASENAAALALTNVSFIESDLFASVSPGMRFNLMVANLPYIPRPELAALSREVRWDPALALDGGEAGLEVIARFAAQARAFAAPDATVALETGIDQGPATRDALLEAAFERVEILCDMAGCERFVFGHAATRG
jgi:release factor glutamine methyltransferase